MVPQLLNIYQHNTDHIGGGGGGLVRMCYIMQMKIYLNRFDVDIFKDGRIVSVNYFSWFISSLIVIIAKFSVPI